MQAPHYREHAQSLVQTFCHGAEKIADALKVQNVPFYSPCAFRWWDSALTQSKPAFFNGGKASAQQNPNGKRFLDRYGWRHLQGEPIDPRRRRICANVGRLRLSLSFPDQ